jgi:hypothetical protein
VSDVHGRHRLLPHRAGSLWRVSIEELSKLLGQIKVSSTDIAAKTTFTAIEATGGVQKNDLTLVIALLPLARSF